MIVNITRYRGTRYAHVAQPPRFLVPPSAVMHLFRGAAHSSPDRPLDQPKPPSTSDGDSVAAAVQVQQIDGEGLDNFHDSLGVSRAALRDSDDLPPEAFLWWGVLRQALDDIFASGRDFMHEEQIPELLDAVAFLEEPAEGFPDFLSLFEHWFGLEPAFIRRKLRECGYLGHEFRVRKMSPTRSLIYAPVLDEYRRADRVGKHRHMTGSRFALEQIQQHDAR